MSEIDEGAEGTPTFQDEDGDEQQLPAEFATATMGHILLGQGRSAEALAVFRAVLARSPEDAEALRGLAALSPTTPPPPAAPVRAFAARTVVEAVPVDPTSLSVRWAVAEASLAALGFDGSVALAVEVVSFSVGVLKIERAAQVLEGVEAEGGATVEGLPEGGRHHVAVGVRRAEGRFVPLKQAVPVATPRSVGAVVGAYEAAVAVATKGASAGSVEGTREAATAGASTAEEASAKLHAFYAAAWARGVSSS